MGHILAQLSGATVFTKLDANAGFGQIKLSEESTLYTTFIIPFGRYVYCFKRLPFGIMSAPNFFQKKMLVILTNLDGVICMTDDILIYGRNQEEYNKQLSDVLNKLQQAGVTLNKEKCKLSSQQVVFNFLVSRYVHR